ncbi:MAG: hypothetical protein R8P61_05870 [Bacteroidia bacterium]|nr:hypothetical protein [Bacteroidia bacterium]
MLVLTASPTSTAYQSIVEKLEELSLAKKLLPSEQEEEISLKDGEEVYVGEEAILSHLDELARIVHQWYDCHC